MVQSIFCLSCLQKNKADGPTEPEQPAKRKPPVLDLDAASDADGTHQPAADLGESCDAEKLKKEIDEQGGKVRALKAEKADKVSTASKSSMHLFTFFSDHTSA